VKEFWKSFNRPIWWIYGQQFGVFFDLQCRLPVCRNRSSKRVNDKPEPTVLQWLQQLYNYIIFDSKIASCELCRADYDLKLCYWLHDWYDACSRWMAENGCILPTVKRAYVALTHKLQVCESCLQNWPNYIGSMERFRLTLAWRCPRLFTLRPSPSCLYSIQQVPSGKFTAIQWRR